MKARNENTSMDATSETCVDETIIENSITEEGSDNVSIAGNNENAEGASEKAPFEREKEPISSVEATDEKHADKSVNENIQKEEKAETISEGESAKNISEEAKNEDEKEQKTKDVNSARELKKGSSSFTSKIEPSVQKSTDQILLPDGSKKSDMKLENIEEKKSLVENGITVEVNKVEEPTDFTDIVGKNGKWQKCILLFTLLSGVSTAWNHLGMSFLAFPADHWCSRPNNSKVTVAEWWDNHLPNVTLKGKIHHSQCEMFIYNESNETGMDRDVQPCESWEFSSEFYSIVNHWNLVCDDEWWISTSQSGYMVGFLVSVYFFGLISDRMGRHPAIMASVFILISAGIATAFSTSFAMFSIFRAVVAFGQSGIALVLFVLCIESVGAEYRAKYSIYQSFGWPLGCLVLPFFAWLVQDWLYLQLIMTLPWLFYISYYWLVPESPRWLLSKGKIEKAIPILESVAEKNGIVVKNLEDEAKKICNFKGVGKEKSPKIAAFSLLRTPNLRKKTLCLYFIWFAIAFTYYGLSLNTNDLEGNDYLNFSISGFVEIPAALFCLFTLDRFGRKKPFMFTLAIGGFSCFGCIFVTDGHWKTALAMIGKLMVSAAFTIVYIHSAEIFPTVARNSGVGTSSTIARVGSSIAPFMRDLGKATNPGVPMAIFGAVSLISGALVAILPETNGKPIPETIDQAENFEKGNERKCRECVSSPCV